MGEGRSFKRGGRSPGFGPEDNTFNSVASRYDSDHMYELGTRVRSTAGNSYREFLNRHKSTLDVDIVHELNSIEFQLEDGTETIDEVDGQGYSREETGTETIDEEYENNSSDNENDSSDQNENETGTEVIDEAPVVEIIDPITRSDIRNEIPDPKIRNDIQVNEAPKESTVIESTEVTGEAEQGIEDNSVRGGDVEKDNQISEPEDKADEGSNEADEEATVTSEEITEEPVDTEESEVEAITETPAEDDTHTVEEDPEGEDNEVEEDATDEPLWDWENDMFGENSDRDEPFNDLVVFIWNSWKLVIGKDIA